MKLKYGWNAETAALDLTDPEGLLRPHEWRRWSDEMSRRANLQELHDGLEIEFPPARDLPTRFRVRQAPGASSRVPDYTLEAVEPRPASPRGADGPPAAAPTWARQFLAEARAFLDALPADRETGPGLLYLWNDLADQVRQGPDGLAPPLLCAFAAAQYLRCAAAPDQARRALMYYEISLEALDRALLEELRRRPTTLTDRLAGLFAFLRPAREAPRGGK